AHQVIVVVGRRAHDVDLAGIVGGVPTVGPAHHLMVLDQVPPEPIAVPQPAEYWSARIPVSASLQPRTHLVVLGIDQHVGHGNDTMRSFPSCATEKWPSQCTF